MYYGSGFFSALVTLSLVSLVAVFTFQLWAFFKDKQEKSEETKNNP